MLISYIFEHIDFIRIQQLHWIIFGHCSVSHFLNLNVSYYIIKIFYDVNVKVIDWFTRAR